MREVRSQEQQRQPIYKFDCPMCSKIWSGDELTQLAKNIAWHWNKEHGDNLKHNHERIDTVERGGHNVHENEWVIERIPIYITAFDVMDRIGLEDGYATPPENSNMCDDCKQIIHNEDNGVVVEESVLSETWRCDDCENQRKIDDKIDANHQLNSFGT